MERHLKALLIALALLALYAVPVAAQGASGSGSITITIDCGAPESIIVENNTDEAISLETVNSSEGRTSDVEIDLDNTEAHLAIALSTHTGSSGGEHL